MPHIGGFMKATQRAALTALALAISVSASACGVVEQNQPTATESQMSVIDKQSAHEVKVELDGFITDVDSESAALMAHPPPLDTTREQHSALVVAAMQRTYAHLTLLDPDKTSSIINTFEDLALVVQYSKTPDAKAAAVESRISISGDTASIRGSGIAVGDIKPVTEPDTSGQIDFSRIDGAWKITGYAERPAK